MKNNLQSFKNDLSALQIHLSEKQIDQFVLYYQLLIEKNKVMNLTSITEFDEVMKKHFIDSLSLIKVIDPQQIESMIDIGTGAGFPGIPLKIAFPHIRVTLLDSLHKRVQFLQEVTDELHLTDIDVIHGRAEDYAKPDSLREKFDLCVSRAVANLSVLSEYCIPYVKLGGNFVSYKSEKIDEEYKEAEHAIQILGGKVKQQFSFELPDTDIHRVLFVVHKCETTPLKYPRKAGSVQKKPIV